MSSDHSQARLQSIEERVANLDDTVAVLAMVDDVAAKERIERVFADDPRMVIVYRGMQRGLTQQETADALRARGLPGAQQADVSRARSVLVDEGFLKREGRDVLVRGGWQPFGLDKALRNP